MLTPDALESFRALALGFAFSGFLAAGFEYLTHRKASFTLLQIGGPTSLACVPIVVFSAPFIILRNTLRGRRFERRPMGFVMLATIISGLWSLMAGRVMLDLIAMISV